MDFRTFYNAHASQPSSECQSNSSSHQHPHPPTSTTLRLPPQFFDFRVNKKERSESTSESAASSFSSTQAIYLDDSTSDAFADDEWISDGGTSGDCSHATERQEGNGESSTSEVVEEQVSSVTRVRRLNATGRGIRVQQAGMKRGRSQSDHSSCSTTASSNPTDFAVCGNHATQKRPRSFSQDGAIPSKKCTVDIVDSNSNTPKKMTPRFRSPKTEPLTKGGANFRHYNRYERLSANSPYASASKSSWRKERRASKRNPTTSARNGESLSPDLPGELPAKSSRFACRGSESSHRLGQVMPTAKLPGKERWSLQQKRNRVISTAKPSVSERWSLQLKLERLSSSLARVYKAVQRKTTTNKSSPRWRYAHRSDEASHFRLNPSRLIPAASKRQNTAHSPTSGPAQLKSTHSVLILSCLDPASSLKAPDLPKQQQKGFSFAERHSTIISPSGRIMVTLQHPWDQNGEASKKVQMINIPGITMNLPTDMNNEVTPKDSTDSRQMIAQPSYASLQGRADRSLRDSLSLGDRLPLQPLQPPPRQGLSNSEMEILISGDLQSRLSHLMISERSDRDGEHDR